MILSAAFVEEVVLEDDEEPTGAFGCSRHWDKHMGGWVDSRFLLSDDCVHPEVHFVVDYRLFNSSSVDNGLLVLDLAVVHFDTDKHCVVTTSIQAHNVDAYTMGLVGLTRGVDYQLFFLALHHIHEFLLLDCSHHYCSALGIHCQVLTCIDKRVPGTMRRHPDLPKVSSWVLRNLLSF